MDYFDIRIDLSGLPESEQEEIKKDVISAVSEFYNSFGKSFEKKFKL